MKVRYGFVVALVLALAGFLSSFRHQTGPTFESRAQSASGAIFIKGAFACSGTEIGHDELGNGYFLTARHCVADYQTNALLPREFVSFSSNEKGPFYATEPVALSLTDDIAILRIINGSEIPEVYLIGNEYALKPGNPIFNCSFPLGMGKLVFHGEFTAPRFLKIDERMTADDWGDQWNSSMPINLTIAHGSSGSGVFSSKQRALIGVVVGTFREGAFNIAIPASRVKDLLLHLSDNTVEKFVQTHPVKEVLDFF